jgi:cardiolipin synthase
MLDAIEASRSSVRLETYIYAGGPVGRKFREALVRAQQRGVRVRVLVDALGSMGLPYHFWDGLISAGGEVRWFNPAALMRFSFRDHRKLLVCDDQVAFIGGFNIAREYQGDGVHSGWRDLGIKLVGPLAAQLAASFDEMFKRANFQHKRFVRLRRFPVDPSASWPPEQVFFSEPGRGRNPIKLALRGDLARAQNVQIMVGYFLPTWRLRRDLMRVAERGGRVQLILPGISDVPLSRLAAQSLYGRLLRHGVEIHEYQPQILHAKLIIVDNVVYVGSSNLDLRSLRINYELMVRIEDRDTVAEARGIFAGDLGNCRRIELSELNKFHPFWLRLKQRLAYYLLVKVDPNLARRLWRSLPE